MSETASRRLFLAEVIVLAFPVIIIMVALAMPIGGVALQFGAAALAGVARPGSLELFLAAAVVIALTAAGLAGLIKFIGLSVVFWREGRAGLRAERREFRQGLAFGAPAFAVAGAFGLWAVSHGDMLLSIIALYVSGLVLLIPVLHLWLELRSSSGTDAAMSPPSRR